MATAKSISEKFVFKGSIAASKSLMNRALLVQSFFPNLKINGISKCEDVRNMQQAVQRFPAQRDLFCGDAGTVLRFMGIRVSREKGVTKLLGSARLFERPQDDLLFLLNQLNVQTQVLPQTIILESKGWTRPLMPLCIHREKSSQFSTGLLLSAWDLPFALEFELAPPGIQDSYWNMSVAFAENLGMTIEKKGRDRYVIPPKQQISVDEITIEPDYSSMFAVAAAAALCGEARIGGVGSTSLQPDYEFIEIMKKLKVPILLEGNKLGVLKAPKILAQNIIIRDTPDLFPVLAVLLAYAQGPSSLTGAPRLIYKESNRIKKTSELLKLMRVENEVRADGLYIQGLGPQMKPSGFVFDPDEDHRMAMAAGVLMRNGWKIDLANPQMVNKSFPEFWQDLGISI